MPNWCENELTITGPDVSLVLNAIRSEAGEDEDARIIDFNRIIPYPEMYREMDQRAREYEQKFRAISKDDPERQSKLNTLAAEFGVEPRTPSLKDGYNSGGYEWCWEHWGSKWNPAGVSLTTHHDNSKSCIQKIVICSYCQTPNNIEQMKVLVCQQCGSPLPDTRPIRAFLEFDTTWSPPVPVIEKLASMFPDHEFELKYYERGIGFCGHAHWAHGLEQYHHQDDYHGMRGG